MKFNRIPKNDATKASRKTNDMKKKININLIVICKVERKKRNTELNVFVYAGPCAGTTHIHKNRPNLTVSARFRR